MNTNKHSKKVVHLPLFIQKNHKAILFSLLLFLMLPTTFVHAQRLYTTDGVNVRAKPNGSTKGAWKKVKTSAGKKGYVYGIYVGKR